MSTQYWLLYETSEFDPDGPYGDIHRVRDLAVQDASDNGCRVQIHKGAMIDDCIWDSPSLVEEW
jgi:hypothetical protein